MAASINLKIDTNFAQASADLKAFGNLSETQAKKIEKYVESFRSEQLDAFEDRQKRTSAAIKATRGPVDALTSDYKAYQRRIEQLIKNGLDPESDEIQRLVKRYKQLATEIDDATKAEKKHEKASALNAASMVFLAEKAFDVGQRIFEIGKEFVDAASDAEETQNKFDVVFQGLESDAETATEALADGFGLSEQAAMDLLASTGDLLVGFGFTRDAALELSTDVQDLAGDLASFQNLETADVSDRITKALTGETESLKALGVVIRQDTKEYKDRIAAVMEAEGVSITQAKSLVNLAIITEQSANAIGDFARSQDSMANQSRIAKAATEDLKAEIGEALLPAATRAVSVFGDLARMVADYVKESNELKNAKDAIDDGTASLDQQLLVLQKEKDELKAIGTQYNINGVVDKNVTDAATANREAQIAAIDEQIKAIAEQIKWSALEGDNSEEVAAQRIADEKAKQEAAQELAEYLELVGEEYTETEQGKIDALQAEIDLWEMYAETAVNTAPQVQAILEKLREEMAGLTDDTEELEKVQEKQTRNYTKMVEANNRAVAALADQIRDVKNITVDWESVTETAFSSISSGFADVGEAIYNGELAFSSFGAVALNALSEVLSALGAQLAAEAAVSAIGLNFGAAALATAASAAAYTASGFVSAAASDIAGTAQTGTMPSGFTVPDSASTRGDSQLLAVNPGEQVNVTPRGQSSSGGMMTVNVYADRELLITQMQDIFDANEVTVTTDNIRSNG